MALLYLELRDQAQRVRAAHLQQRAREARRKLNLYALDKALWILEALNLREQRAIPPPLADQLLAFRIPYRDQAPPEVIEMVFTAQADYLLRLATEWSANEDAQLRLLYPLAEADRLLDVLPGRSWGAIEGRAKRLGLRRILRPASEWSAAEDAQLRLLYPLAAAGAVLEALPDRSWKAVEHRAKRLGLRRRRGQREQPDAA